MQSKEEIQAGIAGLFRRIRADRKMSKSRISNLVYVDDHTWTRYEEGLSCPTVVEFIDILSRLRVNALPEILAIIYPETYGNISASSDTKDLREAAARYMLEIASDKTVREIDYLIFGGHGSNIENQIQEITMLNHLPLAYRIVVAENILSLYRIAEARGDLIGADHVMPETALVEDGIRKATEAIRANATSYTTAQR